MDISLLTESVRFADIGLELLIDFSKVSHCRRTSTRLGDTRSVKVDVCGGKSYVLNPPLPEIGILRRQK